MATKKEEKELAVIQSAEVPDYIKMDTTRGSEEVTQDDLIIPRLEIAQALSPCIKKSDSAYIEGVEQGMLYNNVSRELYGNSVLVVPIMFRKEWLIWRDRKQGGGFRGAFPSKDEAMAQIQNLVDEGESGLEAVDTGQHFCLLVKEDGKIEEIAISMSRSKMKVSRQFNSLVRMAGGDRFSRVYKIQAVEDQNDSGDDFWNLKVTPAGFPSRDIYKMAEEIYETIASGERDMKVSTDVDTSEEGSQEENPSKF